MTDKKVTRRDIYEKLSKIDVRKYLKTKGAGNYRLTYLSWANAWGLAQTAFDDITYKIKDFNHYYVQDGQVINQPLDYRITKAGCEVEVTVTIEGYDYTQKLYAMDNRNKVIPEPNLAQINKAQQRCLVKALALAGLGLNIYAGEDLPSNDDETAKKPARPTMQRNARQDSLDQSVEKIKDGAKNMPFDEKHAEKISDNVLLEYTYDLNGKKHSMSKLVKAFASSNAQIKVQAKEVADTLQGKDAIAFIELSKRAERLGLLG